MDVIYIPCDKENKLLKNVMSGHKRHRSKSPARVSIASASKKAPSVRRILGDLPTPKSDNIRKKGRSLENYSCQPENTTPVKRSYRKSLDPSLVKPVNSTCKFASGIKFEVKSDGFEKVSETCCETDIQLNLFIKEHFIDRSEHVLPNHIPPTMQKVVRNECPDLVAQHVEQFTKQEEHEITEFVDTVLLQCLGDVKLEEVSEGTIPDIQLIPPTPLEDEWMENWCAQSQSDHAPVFQLTAMDLEIVHDEAEDTDFEVDSHSSIDSNKENVCPESIVNLLSNLYVECDDDIDSSADLSHNISDLESNSSPLVHGKLQFSLFDPDMVCSPICYKNYQLAGQTRAVLGSLPLLNHESGDAEDSVLEDYCESVKHVHLVTTCCNTCSPLEDTAAYTTQETNTNSRSDSDVSMVTHTKTYMDVSVLTEGVDVHSVAISPMKSIMVDNNTMTNHEPTFDRSMETIPVEVLDRSMQAQCTYTDESMMTESTSMCNAETYMTPLKLINKRGKRMSAEEVRRQHPRTLANNIDTLIVCNAKLDSESKLLKKENTRLKTVIKDLKSTLSTTSKQVEEFDSIRSQEKKYAQKLQGDILGNLNGIIRDQEKRLQEHQHAHNVLQHKIQEYECCQTQLKKDVLIKEEEYALKLHEQSNCHAQQMIKMESDMLSCKEQYAEAGLLLKEQEEQIQILQDVEDEANKLVLNQDMLMKDLCNIRTMINAAVNNNVCVQQQLQLQWSCLKEKRMEVSGEVEGYKMNNRLLLEEMTDLRDDMTEKYKLLEEIELKYLSAEQNLETAATEYYKLQHELDESRKIIDQFSSIEEDLKTAYQEIETLRSTLKQTEDTLQHEQYRYANKQEEMTAEKQNLDNRITLSENLVLNLQRTVDFRERDVERLEEKLYNQYTKLEEQKEKLDTFESQLFQCQEDLQQKAEDIESLERYCKEREGVVEICLQSAREADEMNRDLTTRMKTLQTINQDNDDKQSQLVISFGQLQQDYLVSRQSLKDGTDKYSIIIKGKDEELEKARAFMMQFDLKISAYMKQLENKISHEDLTRRKQMKKAINSLYSSSLDKLNDQDDSPDSTSILGPNAKPHRRAESSWTLSCSVPATSSSPLNTSVYNHVTCSSTTPGKSLFISNATELSCKKLKEFVEQRRKQHLTPSKNVRHLEFSDPCDLNSLVDHRDSTEVCDGHKSLNNSVLAIELDNSNCNSLSDLCSAVDKRFEDVEKLVASFEQSKAKLVQILSSDKEDLEVGRHRFEKQLQMLKLDCVARSEAESEANREKGRLKVQLEEFRNRMDKFSDQQIKIKCLEREKQKLIIDVQNQKEEIKLLTDELDIFFTKSRGANSNPTDDRRELLDLKRKNQQLRLKMIENYNCDGQARKKIEKLEETVLHANAEVSRYTELVDTVKETLTSNKDSLDQIPNLQQLLNIINGSDINPSASKNSLSFYDSFMF